MPDNRVVQPAEGMCVTTAAACVAEVKSQMEVTADIPAKHKALVDAGLAESMTAGVNYPDMIPALTLLGQNGFEVKEGNTTGVVYLYNPRNASFEEMVAGLTAGFKGYILYYRTARETGHSDCIVGIEPGNLIAADSVNTAPDASTKIIPIDWVKDRTYGVYVYDNFQPTLEPNAYDEWRAGKRAAGEADQNADQFQGHINALADLDGGSRNIYDRGFPYPPSAITIIEPPTAEPIPSGIIPFAGKTQFMGIQVWQKVPASTIAAFCSRTGINSVCTKALDGTFWMGGISEHNPGSPEAVAAMRDYYHSVNLQFGVWTNPLSSVDLKAQADQTILAALNADYLVLDIEPYAPDFWGANNRKGLAESFCMALREGLGPDYPIGFQPDPRTARLQEIRYEEWTPYMSGWMSQHYYIDFQDTPESQAYDAVAKRALYMPNGALCPTFPVRPFSNPNDLASAVKIIKDNLGCGFMIWRDTLCSDLSAMAAVKAFTE